MNVKPSEKKPGGNSGPKYIGYGKGELKWVNPDTATIKEIYKLDELPEEEPKYTGTDKNEKDWSLLTLIFEEEISKIPVPYKIFFSKEVAEFEKDGVTKTWYVNQLGESQCVADKKDLFRSFTHLQTWNKEESKMVDVPDSEGNPIELSWRKAYKGETSLYSLLRKLVTQDWFQATAETSLFIKIDSIMRGNFKDITSFIGTENFQPVVFMSEIAAKDTENGVAYYQNCVDQAWMPGWKIKEANLATASNTWNKYEDKASGKGKNRDIYQFYQSIKRSKNITDLKYLHEFTGEESIAAGSEVIQHSDKVEDTEY